MNETIRQIQQTAEPYDLLPEGVKTAYSRIEYMWLSDHEKVTLIQRETEPEY